MRIVLVRPDRYCLTAVGKLTTEFKGVLPRRVVTDTVLRARRDLEGRIVHEAVDVVLQSLARHRLDRLRTEV